MLIKKNDSNMNSSRVVIDNAFDFLEHICILKHFNSKIDWVAQVIFFVVATIIVNCGVHKNLDLKMQKQKLTS
jgi:hypothetical protein